MKLSDFDYCLPKELIAQYPLKERDSARLLVVDRKKSALEHRTFKEIADYLEAGDLLVLNDTKVLPSRLFGRRHSGGKVEILLLNRKEGLVFEAMIKPARVKTGERIIFNGGKTEGIISARNEVTFNLKEVSGVYALGVMPLPPYIKRLPEELDSVYYQTVYANIEGAIASPTAGLHFTEELLEKIRSRGIGVTSITLHVGAGTFKPVKAEDVTAHKMDPEYFKVSGQAAGVINEAQAKNKRVFAVGTTSLRALEAFSAGMKEGYTDLFIYPGYKFKSADCLLTNFHLPCTTLYMLVCAFCGKELAREAYREAIDKKYRFYSYGDAMLIL